MVYVLDKNGQLLMPTNRHGKVKHLLKDGKAKVIRKCPFTMKLLYESTNHTQNLTLGVDTKSGTIGNAVSDDSGSIVYMSKVFLRNDITDRMTRRAKYRRNRRNRKTRMSTGCVILMSARTSWMIDELLIIYKVWHGIS